MLFLEEKNIRIFVWSVRFFIFLYLIGWLIVSQQKMIVLKCWNFLKTIFVCIKGIIGYIIDLNCPVISCYYSLLIITICCVEFQALQAINYCNLFMMKIKLKEFIIEFVEKVK